MNDGTTLEGKTVLITGANRGIGEALVAEALRRGASRVFAGMRQPTPPAADSRMTPIKLDVTDQDQIRSAAASITSLDVLVNNAGIQLYDDLSDAAALEQQLAVNLYGPLAVTNAFTLGAACSSALDLEQIVPWLRPGWEEALSPLAWFPLWRRSGRRSVAARRSDRSLPARA